MKIKKQILDIKQLNSCRRESLQVFIFNKSIQNIGITWGFKMNTVKNLKKSIKSMLI